MDELIRTISNELSIQPYRDEDESQFIYRVLLSSLGVHCLLYSYKDNDINLQSKSAITSYINEICNFYLNRYPFLRRYFLIESNRTIGKFVRTIYEELGYLIEYKDGLKLSNCGRKIALKGRCLYFGMPNADYYMRGLGLYTDGNCQEEEINKILLRDNLSINDFVNNNYEDDEFKEIDFKYQDIYFFNPLSKFSNSQSWKRNDCTTEYSLCQFDNNGIYYKAKKEDKKIKIKRLIQEMQKDDLYSKEYRRYYFALKNYYKNSSIATCRKIDKDYSEIRLTSKLPNREYYFLLLLSWPKDNVLNEINFLIDNKNAEIVKMMLNNIGIKMMEVSK